MLTIKLQSEATAVGQLQIKRFTPVGFPVTFLRAKTQQTAYAMPALHEKRRHAPVGGALALFEGFLRVRHPMGGIEGPCTAVGNVEQIGILPVFAREGRQGDRLRI